LKKSGIADKVIDRGALLVYGGTRSFALSDELRVVPAADLLTGPAAW
jgi:hypothetical protein